MIAENAGCRVLLGLSGGVDSGVAAMILKEQGYNVTAARMIVHDGPDDDRLAYGCYGRGGREETESARKLAEQLDIPFLTIDCTGPFKVLVLDYFRREYLAGRTPNPCVRCNETVKFGAFWALAQTESSGFDFFATGHYARTALWPGTDQITIRRGADQTKDQSYFLYRLLPDVLARTIFPLGGLTKAEVRSLAAARGLVVHNKPDSQDFYGGDYADLLQEPGREGNIVDSAGRVLGRHQGFWRFTPGQRKGLGVAAAHPLYVLKVTPERNEVVVGPAAENSYQACRVDDLNLFAPRPKPGTKLLARMRSSQPLREVIVTQWQNDSMRVEFARPVSGMAPGQSLVLYDGDLVVGGGVIVGL